MTSLRVGLVWKAVTLQPDGDNNIVTIVIIVTIVMLVV